MDSNTQNTNQNDPQPSQQTQSAQSQPDIVAAVLKAIEERERRVGSSVVRSMAEQYGMKQEELTALLEAEKAKKAKALPPEVQQQLEQATEKAHKLMLTAQVQAAGASMGLLDADAALLLMDRTKIKIDSDDKITGVQEALDKLKSAKPFLFGVQTPRGMAARQGGAPAAQTSGVEAAFLRRNPGLKIE